MSGRWRTGAGPVLVGAVAGVLIGLMGAGQAQPAGPGAQPAVTVTAGSHAR